jgi:hypothetical protein
LAVPGPASRAEHEALAQMVLGVGRRGEAHALLVLPAIERQLLAVIVERLAQAGTLPWPKMPKPPPHRCALDPVDLDELVHQIAHDGLRHRQPDGLAHS